MNTNVNFFPIPQDNALNTLITESSDNIMFKMNTTSMNYQALCLGIYLSYQNQKHDCAAYLYMDRHKNLKVCVFLASICTNLL